MTHSLRIEVADEAWPLREAFVISRGAKTEARVVVTTVTDGILQGRGEAVPYARYGETVDGVIEQIRSAHVSTRDALRLTMPAGAARNAIDCALWDLEAKRSGSLSSLYPGSLNPLVTCFTISLGTPEEMAAKARSVPGLPLLKLKLGGAGDADRMRAVRAARPDARLVADANEAWPQDLLQPLIEIAAEQRFELIEQPLRADADEMLTHIERRVPVCADESAHTRADLAGLRNRYDAVNIKLDKAGGLTEALDMRREAEALGLKVMVGCMVASSLAMAPAFLLAQTADWVDLDGPLLLALDRPSGLSVTDGIIQPPAAALWG